MSPLKRSIFATMSFIQLQRMQTATRVLSLNFQHLPMNETWLSSKDSETNTWMYRTYFCIKYIQLAPYFVMQDKTRFHLVRIVLSCNYQHKSELFTNVVFFLNACIRNSKRPAYKCSTWASDEPCCQNKEQFGVKLTRKRLWTIFICVLQYTYRNFCFYSFPCGYPKNETKHMFCHSRPFNMTTVYYCMLMFCSMIVFTYGV